MCRRAALLSQTSRDHSCGRVTWQVLMRGKPLTTVVDEHSKGGGFSSAALGHRPQNRAKGADPRTGNLKGEKCFCPGVLSSTCPGLPVPGLSWFRFAGSPALPLRVPLCFGSASCFFLLAAGVAFQLPAGGTSGQAQWHRPKNRHRAPTQGPALQVSLCVWLCCVPRRAWLVLSFPCTLLFYYGGPGIAFLVCWNFLGDWIRAARVSQRLGVPTARSPKPPVHTIQLCFFLCPSCRITPPAFQCSLASQKILSSLNDGFSTVT